MRIYDVYERFDGRLLEVEEEEDEEGGCDPPVLVDELPWDCWPEITHTHTHRVNH